jgi:hypothetical protein
MNHEEIKKTVEQVKEGFEAYKSIEEAMEVLERITRNDDYARSYWFAHLKISLSPNHGYISRDSNLLEWLSNKMEEVMEELDLTETHDGFYRNFPEEVFPEDGDFDEWMEVVEEIRYRHEG